MEDNLKRIVSEATRLCRERGQKVDPNVLAYVAALEEVRGAFNVIAPGAALEGGMTAEAVAALGDHVSQLCMDASNARIRTAAMQILMEVAFKQQRELIEKEQGEQQERAGMLQRAVTGPRALRGNTPDAYDKFYKLVLEAVCVEAGMELAVHDQAANAEVRAALESVFPVSAVARFATLSEEERAAQLAELARIVTGICLYNRSLGRGGSALPAAAAQYLPQAQRLLRDISRCGADAAEQLAALQLQVSRLPPPAGGEADTKDTARQKLHAEVLHRGQAVQLFESLQADLQEGLDAAQQLDNELEATIVAVHDTVGSSAAVSKDAVYPLFDRLGALHTALHQELRMLVVRQRLYDELTELSVLPPGSSLAPPPAAGKKAGAKATASVGTGTAAAAAATSAAAAVDALAEQLSETTLAALDNMASSGAAEAAAGGAGLEYIRPAGDALQPGLALCGFCPATLARRPTGPWPLLQRANPRLGYLAYQDKVYGFATNADMQAFIADPAGVLGAGGLGAALGDEPLLVRLLGVEPPAPPADVHAVLKAMSGPLKVDFGCQTPVHFLERHIDKDYEWNVWALRRRALALANLRGKATHSAQTNESHFKRENETQVWKPREATVQTRADKGQAMPRKLQYVAGLRGAPDVKMNVVRLELDLGQPHQH